MLNQGSSDIVWRCCDHRLQGGPPQEVSSGARCLSVLGVKQACCEFLESQLDPSNCLGIRDFAETHNCVDLMQAAEVFSQKHFPEVVQHEEFILLSQGEVEKLIKCDEIQVQTWRGLMLCSRWGPKTRKQGGVTVLLVQGFFVMGL